MELDLKLFNKIYTLSEDLFGVFIKIKKNYYLQLTTPSNLNSTYCLTLYCKRQQVYIYCCHFEVNIFNVRNIGRDLEDIIDYERQKAKKGIKTIGLYRL